MRGHHVSAVVPEGDMAFSRRAAARHGDGDGDKLLHWILWDMPYTLKSDAIKQMVNQMTGGSGAPSKLTLLRSIQKMWQRPCALLMANRTLLKDLEGGGYDAIIAYTMPGDGSDSCGCVVSHKLRLPLIAVTALPMVTGPLSVPQFGSGLSFDDLSTWKGRLRNLLYYITTRAMWDGLLNTAGVINMRPIRRLHGLPRGPRHYGCGCEPVVNLRTNSFHLEPPRPFGPPNVLIGAIAPRDARPVLEPPEVSEFLSSADRGAVLVSFGSAPVFGTFMAPEDFLGLAKAFAALAPVRVLWLLKRTTLPGGLQWEDMPIGNNTFASGWVDINDALGHPNVKLFVTHGGMHSVYEAMHHGKPVVGAPFQFEQQANLEMLRAKGMGELSPEAPASRPKGSHYTEQGMRDLISKVFTTPSYVEAAARIGAAARLHSSLRPPLRLAVEEVEMAMEHMNYGMYRTYSCGRDGGDDNAGPSGER